MGLPCSLSQFISICYYHFEHLFLLNQITLKVKGSGPCRFGKKIIEFVLFYMQLLCSINFCFGPFEMWQFKNNCSGLKIDWGSPPGCSYLWNAYYVIIFCCFTEVFVDSAYKQLTMALSQAHHLLRHNNLSGDLTNDCVNHFISFFE